MDPNRADRSLPVDLIRTVAIVLVILLHASAEPVQIADEMALERVTFWWTANIYDSLSRPCVPLFVILTGALLLQPSKTEEPLNIFFRKRIARITIPFLFWSIIYFLWRFIVNQETLSLNPILTGILTGPYNHFWFLYMIFGLYLITPILRIIVAHADWKIVKYFLLVWLVGTSIAPLITIWEPLRLHSSVFVMTGWIGYFLLGAYIQKIQWRSLILGTILFLGLAWTIIGTYIITSAIGARQSQFFYDSFSINVIGTSIALFLLLSTVSPSHIKSRFPHLNGLLHQISQNTLPSICFM